MIDPGRLALFAAALAAACAIPGPATAAMAARGLSHGILAALPLCAGLVLGDLFWCALSMYGAGVVFERWPILAHILKYAGAVWLAWLAWKFWHAVADANQANAAGAGARPLFDGFAIALANPKTMLFYLALLPTIVDAPGAGPYDFAAPALVILCVCGGVLSVYALAGAAVRRGSSASGRMRMQRVAAVLIALTALLLAGTSWGASQHKTSLILSTTTEKPRMIKSSLNHYHLAVAVCLLGLVGMPVPAAEPDCGAVRTPQQRRDADTIRRIEQGWLAAEYRGNVDFLDCLLTPGYKVILAKDASVKDKADLLARVAKNRGKDTEVPALQTTVVINGDQAIAYSSMKTQKKTSEPVEAHYVDSYVFENGVWRAYAGVDL